MKPKILISFLALALFLCWGCQTDKHRLSPEMASVLSKRRLNKWEMDTAGMEQHRHVEFEKSDDEIFGLPERPGTADTFVYRVVVRKSENRFWIVRAGGVAGVWDVFGPAGLGK